MSIKKKIYIAGPGVFKFEDWKGKKTFLENLGFETLYPLDQAAKLELGKPKQELSYDIYRGNIEFIKTCDIVLADLNEFRGHLMDDGTAFEIGYASAIGKRIYGFINDDRELFEKYSVRWGESPSGDGRKISLDEDDYEVEDLGDCINLMIANSIRESGGKILFGSYTDAGILMAKDEIN